MEFPSTYLHNHTVQEPCFKCVDMVATELHDLIAKIAEAMDRFPRYDGCADSDGVYNLNCC